MSPRLLSVLAAASLIAVAAAGYAVSTERGFETLSENTKVFPDLREKLNDVTQVKIVTGQREMTLMRGTDGWTMKESDGYPAEVKSIQKALIGLADLVYMEAKTKKSELYAKLDLRDTTVDESRARHVSVSGADGDLLADVLLGKTRYNMPGTTRDGIYLRFPGEDQSWLAIGQLEASKSPSDWLKTDVTNIPGNTIKTATFTHADGERLTVEKATENSEAFTLLNIPEDKKLKFDTDPKNMATVLEELDLQDVRKDSHFDFDKATGVTAEYQTFSGMTVKVQMIELTIEGAAEDEENSEAWIKISSSGSNDEARAQAKTISDHTSGWAFKIPNYKASRINKRMDNIIEDKKAGS